MRRSFLGVVPVTLALLSSCTGMVQSDLDQTHEKLTALQELVNNANQNLSSLQQLVAELDDSHTVSAVSPVGENGYDLSFRDGKVVRISYGKQESRQSADMIRMKMRITYDVYVMRT